jgi:ubiquinone biosynthesis protein
VISRGRRYRKVFAVLAKHGFNDVVGILSGNKLFKLFRSTDNPVAQNQQLLDRWIRLRNVLEELGPTYIKFGQIISNRPGIVPDDLITELSKLQDAVPPFPVEQVIEILEQDFNKPLAEVFRTFDPIPLASASIAQVHRAELFTGEQVVIKVQRPGIEEIIKADIEILKDIANLMQRSEELSALRPKELVVAFEQTILSELNFSSEANHFRKFHEKFSGDPTVKIPAPYLSYCTKRVVTIEFLDGIKISNNERLTESGFDKQLIAQRGFDAYFKQIFEWGYFHSDPHPGNLLVLPGNVIGILDFGMVGKLSEKDRRILVEFIIALGRDDTASIVDNIEKLQGSEVVNKEGLERDMAAFIDEFGGQASKDIDLNDALNRGRFLINKYRLKLNPDLFLLLRTVSMLEGIGTSLDPDFRSLGVIRPYVIKLLRERLKPQNLLKSRTLLAFLSDISQLFISLPADSRKIIEKIKHDKLKITVENRSTLILARQVNSASKLISYALLTGIFFTGGCYLFTSPKLNTVIPAMCSFAVAGIMLVLFLRIAQRK